MLNFSRITVVVIMSALLSIGFADTSLKLGSSFPGWDKQPTSGVTYESAKSIITRYARQIGHTCFSPELFHRSGATSIFTAKVFYDMGVPFGATENVLLDDFDERVALIEKRYGSDVLSVLVTGDRGVYLILC